MNKKILLFLGIILAIPFIASAKGGYKHHAYTVQCEALDETKCLVTSNRTIKSVRVELLQQGGHFSQGFVKKDFQDCPAEVSVHFNSVPGAKLFIDTCDGSSAIKTISL